MYGHFKNLQLCSLTPEQHQRTCNYWYVITDGSSPHTAFETERGLYRWLQERGIELTQPLPERGTHSWQKLKGAYTRRNTMDANAFAALQGEHTKVLDNGEYTLGVISRDGDGVVIHHLNCNVKTRPVYDYTSAAKEMR